MVELSAAEVQTYVTMQRIYKTLFRVVVALTVPGLSLTLWMSFGIDFENASNPALLGVFVTFFWALGFLSWGLVIKSRNRIKKLRDVEAIKAVVSTFNTARPLVRNWVENYRNFSGQAKLATYQVESCRSNRGEFQCSFSNNIDVFKFNIFKDGNDLGSINGAFAEFTDNTSIQTYVRSSGTRGTITPTRSFDGHSNILATTTNNLATQRSGSAYVRLEGPLLATVFLAFSSPGEAMNLANLVNSLSANFQSNEKAIKIDLENWLQNEQSSKSNLEIFLMETKDLRTSMAKFEKDLVIQECNRSTFGFLGKMNEADYLALTSN